MVKKSTYMMKGYSGTLGKTTSLLIHLKASFSLGKEASEEKVQ
jgi:hypothetical protein